MIALRASYERLWRVKIKRSPSSTVFFRGRSKPLPYRSGKTIAGPYNEKRKDPNREGKTLGNLFGSFFN